VQSLVTHLLSSSSTLPFKRLAAPVVTTSATATPNVLCPKTVGTTRPPATSTSTAPDQLIRVIRRPTADHISSPTVSSATNPIQPLIFNLPLGNPGGGGGLLLVRNPQPPENPPVPVAVSQPAVACGWPPPPAMMLGQPGTGNSRQVSPAARSPPAAPRNFLLDSSRVGKSAENDLNHGCQLQLGAGTFKSSASTPPKTDGLNIELSSSATDQSDLSEFRETKSSLPCDVLEDLLHIVNETLGSVDDRLVIIYNNNNNTGNDNSGPPMGKCGCLPQQL